MRCAFFAILISTLSLADDVGSLLFNGNCLTCHNETKTLSAPSVLEFKDRYMKAFKTKEEFVSYMSKWIKNPQEKTSLMHDAIKKHGLMPELGFDMQTLIDISGYIYETDFKKRNGYWRNN